MQTAEQDIQVYEKLGEVLFPLLKQYLIDSEKPDTPVVQYLPGAELITHFKDSLEEGTDLDTIADDIKKVMKYSVNTHNPDFYDKLWVGVDAIGVIGEALTAFLNTAVHTYAVSPVASVLEIVCIRELAKHYGWQESESDGIFCPGGNLANVLAVQCARHKYFPHVFNQGWRTEDAPVMFVSACSHYSMKRGGVLAGIGINNVIGVKVDENGCMSVPDLEARIAEALAAGKRPFFVAATCGTTVTGSYDPVEAVVAIARKHDMWVHLDGAWGGPVIFSPEHKHLMKGAEAVDSITIDPHKAMSVAQQCSVLLVKDSKHGADNTLRKTCALNAEYLFHPGVDSDYDRGDKSLMCGRRNDSLKFWLAWRYYGTSGYTKHINHAYANVEHIVKRIKESPAFELVLEPQYLNVCFWFIPPSMRGNPKNLSVEEQREQWAKVIGPIYEQMQEQGTVLVNHNPLTPLNLPRFWRLIVISAKCTTAHMDRILSEIERLGADM